MSKAVGVHPGRGRTGRHWSGFFAGSPVWAFHRCEGRPFTPRLVTILDRRLEVVRDVVDILVQVILGFGDDDCTGGVTGDV